jgi:hypothetical protein
MSRSIQLHEWIVHFFKASSSGLRPPSPEGEELSVSRVLQKGCFAFQILQLSSVRDRNKF